LFKNSQIVAPAEGLEEAALPLSLPQRGRACLALSPRERDWVRDRSATPRERAFEDAARWLFFNNLSEEGSTS